jgi:hypothetical protein
LNNEIDMIDIPSGQLTPAAEAPANMGRSLQRDVDAKTAAWRLAEDCELILLNYGLVDAACTRYFRAAHRWNPSPAAFYWAVRRYQAKQPLDLLMMLVEGDPEGTARWFDVAMTMAERELAQRFLEHGLVVSAGALHATIDYCVEDPAFALACGYAAVKSVVAGAGYRTVRRERREFRAALKRAAATVPGDAPIFHAMRNFCMEVGDAEHSLEARELLVALIEAAGLCNHVTPLASVTRRQQSEYVQRILPK